MVLRKYRNALLVVVALVLLIDFAALYWHHHNYVTYEIDPNNYCTWEAGHTTSTTLKGQLRPDYTEQVAKSNEKVFLRHAAETGLCADKKR